MLKYTRWSDVEVEHLNALLDRQLVTGKKLMLARIRLLDGAIVPEHSHYHEQVCYVLEGALRFGVPGKEITVAAGEVLCIPPHLPHSAVAIGDSLVLDTFYPPREDWLSQDDSYLRGSAAPNSAGGGSGRTLSEDSRLKHVRWCEVDCEQLNPLLGRQMVTGQNLMLARVYLRKGCVVPEHSHMNEQLTHILQGALRFWIDGQEIDLRAGELLSIPSHMPHKAEALEDTVDLDIFFPPRQDWISKSDAYLREVVKT